MLRAELLCQRLLIAPSCDGDSLKTHLRGKLNAQMTKSADTQNGDYITGLRAAVAQRVESSNPGAHQRSGLYV